MQTDYMEEEIKTILFMDLHYSIKQNIFESRRT